MTNIHKVPLANGRGFAIVDVNDAAMVSAYGWIADRRKHTTYAKGRVRGGGHRVPVYLHRLILNCPDARVDHIDGDGLNNTRANLRLASVSQNNANARPRSGGSSRFKGVLWNKQQGKWQARVNLRGRQVHLGFFDDEEEAARAYDAGALAIYEEFARTNQSVFGRST